MNNNNKIRELKKKQFLFYLTTKNQEKFEEKYGCFKHQEFKFESLRYFLYNQYHNKCLMPSYLTLPELLKGKMILRRE
ncbi:unnamed protein product [Paramecium sonneborni]|uniref:Uncharacterized protein n=1 Tax=Paramecium sonneborni TaxID=65129 RepID=A0A8S1R4F2_9CILI|nr:unnamed protein product [Paramecium sonneborni]